MLSLKKNFEFQKIFNKGKWYGGNLISIYALHNAKNDNYLGIAVSKKVSKSSVKRNRIKRLIRECYRKIAPHLKKGYSIIISWKLDCTYEQANYSEIESDLLRCFKKADILIAKEERDA